MRPELQNRIREVHPELSFTVMAGKMLSHGKKSTDGKALRQDLLRRESFDGDFVKRGVDGLSSRTKTDDFLDAMAAVWTAGRILEGRAERLPAVVERDESGLDMAIWV